MSKIEPPPNKIAQFMHEWKNWLFNLWSNQNAIDDRITALENATTGFSALVSGVDITGAASYEVTDIPATATMIRVVISGLSASSDGALTMTIGDSSGYAAAGDVSTVYSTTRNLHTTGSIYIHSAAALAVDTFWGLIDLVALDGDGEIWTINGHTHEENIEVNSISGEIRNTGARIDRLKIVAAAGTIDGSSKLAVYTQ